MWTRRRGFVLLVLLLSSFSQLPCKPIQLIYPNEDHSELLIDEDGLSVLENITTNVGVLSAVGPLHSGKSFFLNQLIGSRQGFALGPTIEPKTRGLWMWETTIEGFGSEAKSLVVLDTEGLFAHNVSETYDAKIFAISTLLSSYLIYNSVKFIDQSSIDYLELLARRAQLFGLKAQLHSEVTQVVTFPKLLWVVQDFFQDTLGQTPTEWLHRLLSAHHREDETPTRLSDIFPTIECATIFLPQADPTKLRYLDTVPVEELLPNYKSDLGAVREKVLREAPMKKRAGFPLNGPGLASLLRTLVSAANSGRFPEVPSMWAGFIRIQALKALQDAEARFTFLLQQHMLEGPLTTVELTAVRSSAEKEVKELYMQLLQGIDGSHEANLTQLSDSLHTSFKGLSDSNEQALNRLTTRERDSLSLKANQQFETLVIPSKVSELEERIQGIYNAVLAEYDDTLTKYKAEHSFKMFRDFLATAIDSRSGQVRLKNVQVLSETLRKASTVAAQTFSAGLSAVAEPLPLSRLQQLYSTSSAAAMAKFEAEAGISLELGAETVGTRHLLSQEIDRQFEGLKRKNDEKVMEECRRERVHLDREARDSISHIPVPLEVQSLVEKVDDLRNYYVGKYTSALTAFEQMGPFNAQLKILEQAIDEEFQARQKENSRRMQVILKQALPTLGLRLERDISNFYLPWSARSFVVQVVSNELEESQQVQDPRLLRDMVQEFTKSTDVRRALDSVEYKFWGTCIVATALAVLIGVMTKPTRRAPQQPRPNPGFPQQPLYR